MRPKESVIEDYLVDRVKATGGEVRKQAWPGHKGSPDRFCWWPNGRHAWIELKRPGGAPEAHQAREIAKMRRAGLAVLAIDNKIAIDIFVDQMTA